MQQLRPRNDSKPAPASAGARYRKHLERYPERSCEGALDRKMKALVRAILERLAPRRRKA